MSGGDDQNPIVGRNDMYSPPSLPPAGKVSREIGLLLLLLGVLGSATVTFAIGRLTETVYAIVLIGEMFIIGQLLSGRTVDLSALAGLWLRR